MLNRLIRQCYRKVETKNTNKKMQTMWRTSIFFLIFGSNIVYSKKNSDHAGKLRLCL
jgi:hypothetical protein